MSDDRIDRAERIRNMREGSRSTDDESADTAAADDTPDEEVASTEESVSDTDAQPTSGAQSAGRDASSNKSDTTAMPTDGGETDDEDAAAAAQRAAAAAADITGDDAGPAVDAGDETGTSAGAGPAAGPEGVELPDQQLLEEAMSESSVGTTEGGARAAAIEEDTNQTEEMVRVLEFSLGDEYYCLDIGYVEEIVKRDAVTRVPNTPAFVDGVVDLRGQITTILEPKEMMDIETEGEQNLIVVFDPDQFEDQGAVGWVVDEVRQVVPITEAEVNNPPVDAQYINGVIDREEYDQFVIWIEPDDALAEATGGTEE